MNCLETASFFRPLLFSGYLHETQFFFIRKAGCNSRDSVKRQTRTSMTVKRIFCIWSRLFSYFIPILHWIPTTAQVWVYIIEKKHIRERHTQYWCEKRPNKVSSYRNESRGTFPPSFTSRFYFQIKNALLI